ncbi:MAG: hypothetical protein GTO40_30280, partial [Deltaproteobacteria bacterium]|nr:hypothetical protein [Deltaproteobacteria bacterium]
MNTTNSNFAELIVFSTVAIVLMFFSGIMPVYAQGTDAGWQQKWERVLNSAKKE